MTFNYLQQNHICLTSPDLLSQESHFCTLPKKIINNVSMVENEHIKALKGGPPISIVGSGNWEGHITLCQF